MVSDPRIQEVTVVAGRLPALPVIFPDWFGHHVTRRGGQACAFQLHSTVFDLEFFRKLLSNGRDDFFTLIHVHVRNSRVAAEGIVRATKRPDVDVVDLTHFQWSGWRALRLRRRRTWGVPPAECERNRAECRWTNTERAGQWPSRAGDQSRPRACIG